jgi:hypothetical protein
MRVVVADTNNRPPNPSSSRTVSGRAARTFKRNPGKVALTTQRVMRKAPRSVAVLTQARKKMSPDLRSANNKIAFTTHEEMSTRFLAG